MPPPAPAAPDSTHSHPALTILYLPNRASHCRPDDPEYRDSAIERPQSGNALIAAPGPQLGNYSMRRELGIDARLKLGIVARTLGRINSKEVPYW